jgi:hypothetical protein
MCLASALTFAQSSTATITGLVTDPSGAVIAGAKVTATNTATGVPHSVNTTSSGSYTLPNLPAGSYTVKVEASRFAAAEVKDVKVNVGDSRDLNVKMSVEGAKTTVEVTAEAPLIETTKTEVSTSVSDLDMQQLPTFAASSGGANDYASLALTAPGVKMDTSTLTGDLIAPGSINNRANLYNVDGANITDQLVSGRDGLGASVDEIQEFQVLTNNYNAEYGQAGGLIINAVTKSGTNRIHGDGHMYFRGRNLQASSPFYNINLFQNAVPAGTVTATPTPHCPVSDFTAGNLTKLDGCDRAPFHRKEGGFTLGGPFIKDKLFWFGSWELSRQAVPLTLTPNPAPALTVQQPINNHLLSTKLDYKINDKHTLSARFSEDWIVQDNLIVQTSSNITPDDLTSNIAHVSSFNVGLVSSLTPTITNEARFAFIRTLTSTPDKTNVPGAIHANGTITGANFCCPQGGLNKRYQAIDNLTWSHGSHTFKTGFNVSYYPWFSLFPQFHFGQYTVNGSNQATSFTYAVGPGEVTSKDNIYGFYWQDTWKPFHNFTVNYGVRYDLEAGAFKGGKIHGPGGTCFQGNGLIPACSSDKNNWQPRLGFTWEFRPGWLFKASGAEVTMLAFNNVVLDSLNFDGTTLNTVTTTNPLVLAAYPNAPNPALLTGGAGTCPPTCGRVRPISPNLHNPEIHMFNASVQHEFGRGLVAEVQYIGQFGSGLFGERDVNAPPVLPDPAHPGFFYFGNRPNPTFTAIRTNENSRTSQYNGMLVSFTKRMSHHFSMNGSYTWSHAITSGEDFFGLSEPGDPSNIKAERGPAFNDIRHAVNLSAVFDTGRLVQTNILRWFTNDITLGLIEQLQSGRPYDFSTGTAGFSNARFFGTGSETQQRPIVLPDGTITTAGLPAFDGLNALFGPGAVANCIASGFFTNAQCASIQNTFTAPPSASGKGAIDAFGVENVDFKQINGNMIRDAGRQSPFYRTDTNLKKTFRIPHSENVRLELQVDALNLFNHSNWQGFNANNITSLLTFSASAATCPGPLCGTLIPNADFFTCKTCMRSNGTIVGSNGAVLNIRNIQSGKISSNLLAPTFGGAGAVDGIGDPTSVDGSRQFQLSFHVRF